MTDEQYVTNQPLAKPATLADALKASLAAARQPLFPRFPADAVLVVDAHNGDEQWTGEEWNAYADRCEANRSQFTVRLIKILDRGDPA
jgi:hypothetical protein